MTPITEDTVQALIDALERREARTRALRANETGRATAEVLEFPIASNRTCRASGAAAAIDDLDKVRRRDHASRTRSGLFLYAPRL